MPERSERILKILCFALAVLFCFRLAHLFLRPTPLADVTIPELPSLPKEAQTDTKDTNAAPARASLAYGTNQLHQSAGTNSSRTLTDSASNAPTAKVATPEKTNSAPGGTAAETLTTSNRQEHSEQAGTNVSGLVAVASEETTNSSLAPLAQNTNRISAEALDSSNSNSTPVESSATGTTNSVSGALASKRKGTNSPAELASVNAGTNHSETASGTNSASAAPRSATNQLLRSQLALRGVHHPPVMGMPGMPFRPGRISGKKPVKLPPDIEARVYRITQSEILGPVIHPMPMALLGIAGDVAFLRAPNGQSGMVKEGDELGGIKLLRIGTNRVLVEEKGQKKELTIFSGLGGESLLPKPETPK